MSSRDKDRQSGQFVNDLLRTEFHKYAVICPRLTPFVLNISSYRKFMAKFIKVRLSLAIGPEVKLMQSLQ